MLLQGLLDLLGGAGDAPPAKTPAPARLERPLCTVRVSLLTMK